LLLFLTPSLLLSSFSFCLSLTLFFTDYL
jgi:hypothetical protein